jgi:LPS export ABC transporter protein LptC
MKYYFYILILIIYSSCANDLEEVKRITSTADASMEIGTNMKIDYTEFGKPRATLTASLLHRFTEPTVHSDFPKGMHLVVVNENGSIENTLDAKFGSMDDSRHFMMATNDVVVVNIKGDKLNTEELIWDQNTKMIYSNKFVKIQTAKEIIYGDSLIADEKFTNYYIKRVTGTVTVKK